MTAFGFATTSRTRQTMLDALKDVAEYELQLIGDFETLGEMLTFVRDEKGRPAAEEGEHDDLVMSLAIAHAIRSQQRTITQGRGARWTDDQWADFQQAGPEQRKELLRLWGTPEEGI